MEHAERTHGKIWLQFDDIIIRRNPGRYPLPGRYCIICFVWTFVRTSKLFLRFCLLYTVIENIIKTLILQGFQDFSCIYWYLRISAKIGSSPASGIRVLWFTEDPFLYLIEQVIYRALWKVYNISFYFTERTLNMYHKNGMVHDINDFGGNI